MSIHAAETPLRDCADKARLGIGAAVDVNALKKDAEYRRVLAREYNLVVPENAMKMQWLQPQRGTFTFADADAIVSFARENKMRVRGHTLLWHQSVPQWLAASLTSRAEALNVMSQHITAVVTHFKGSVVAWDVVNEAFEENGSMRQTPWCKSIGPDYLEHAFRFAHAADPAALLFYNDYNVERRNKKSDAMFAMLKDFKERGVPVHGAGFQCHFSFNGHPSVAEFTNNLARFAALGLELHITELDLKIPTPVTPEKLERQARGYGEIIAAALSMPRCTAVLTWGFTDKYSWIPKFTKDCDAALPFDREFQEKPACGAIRRALDESKNRSTATNSKEERR